MALATQCHACGTVFRITTSQAAAKGGTVRCGECRFVFDALAALVREEDLRAGDASVSTPAAVVDPAAPVVGASDEARHRAVTATPDDVEAEPEIAAVPRPLDDLAPHPQPSPPAPVEPAPEAEPDSVRDAVFEEWHTTPGADLAPPPPAPDLTIERDPLAPAIDEETTLRSSLLAPEPPPRTRWRGERWLLAGLSVLAVVGLAAQAAYVWHDELAARWPQARPTLVAACGPLRCTVEPPIHDASVTIESTGLLAAAPATGTYVLTALLRNRDAIALRYPHLELTLTDTDDRAVLRRALRPEDYLPATSPRAAFPGESELAVRLTFEVSEVRFAGYRLEKLYP